MGIRANRRTRLLVAVVAALTFAIAGAGCGSAGEEPVEVEPEEEVIKLDDPASFELPDNCEDLQEFAAEAAEAYDESVANTQELVDAKARFDGAVNEQMLLGCG